MGFDWSRWKALFPCVGEVYEWTLLLTENGAKKKTIPTNREMIDERERERELTDWWGRLRGVRFVRIVFCLGVRLRAFFFFLRRWEAETERLRARLVHVFKNWKLLFENICGNTCGWKSALKCVKCCLKTKNGCLKTQTKHPLCYPWFDFLGKSISSKTIRLVLEIT